ncbi:hypothetical protein [Ancylomarina longa]|nr:hypothetical protein [Ancylomarina longa]
MRNTKTDREFLYQYGLVKLVVLSDENIKILKNHLFHLKLNQDFIINTYNDVDELVSFINRNE